MDGGEGKKIDLVSSILLLMIAGFSDAADAATLFILPVPVIGQVVYIANAALSPLIWATIQIWFIMKLGFFGKAGLFNLAGGIANVIGIPGTFGTTLAAIWIANHPIAATLARVTTGKVAPARGAIPTRGAAPVRGAEEAARARETEEKARVVLRKVAETPVGEEGPAEAAVAERGRVQVEPGEAAAVETKEAPEKEPGVSEEALGVEPTELKKLEELTRKPLETKGGEEKREKR